MHEKADLDTPASVCTGSGCPRCRVLGLESIEQVPLPVLQMGAENQPPQPDQVQQPQ